jgi:phosphatidylserine decarboxylase
MVKEGYYFGLPLLALGAGAYFLHWRVAAAILVFLGLFVFSFFRDPERVIPADEDAVVSPADGRVMVVVDEQNVFSLRTAAGEMVFKQIAGLIARRVVSWKRVGDQVARGERIGLMRFGSRMDVWLPKDAEILVKPGDTVRGGTSVLARWPLTTRQQSAEGKSAMSADAHLTTAGRRS